MKKIKGDRHKNLKDKYFELINKENYPKTPDISKLLDKIEKEINKFLKDKS